MYLVLLFLFSSNWREPFLLEIYNWPCLNIVCRNSLFIFVDSSSVANYVFTFILTFIHLRVYILAPSINCKGLLESSDCRRECSGQIFHLAARTIFVLGCIVVQETGTSNIPPLELFKTIFSPLLLCCGIFVVPNKRSLWMLSHSVIITNGCGLIVRVTLNF